MVTALRPIEARTAATDAVPTVAAALADAFINDPVYTWMLPRTLRLKPRLRTMFAAEMAQYVLPNGGTVWTTSDYDGAVCELPPGSVGDAEVHDGKGGAQLAAGVRHAIAARGKSAARDGGATPMEPHFYLRIVGVRTALQGKGVGSALMQPTLERADSAGLPAYIEASTERSAALYERLGFVHIDVLELPDGGPPVWRMRRPPAGPTHHAADG